MDKKACKAHMKITYFQLKLFNFFMLQQIVNVLFAIIKDLNTMQILAIILSADFFPKFKYLQIMRKLYSNLLSFALLLLNRVPGIILLFAKEITCVKRIILESYRQCAKDLLMICTKYISNEMNFY